MSKKRKRRQQQEETWACGDCGTEYPYSVDYCTENGLDHAHLALQREFPTRAQRIAAYPIYFSVARDLNIVPPHPSGKPWPWESSPYLSMIHYEGREAAWAAFAISR